MATVPPPALSEAAMTSPPQPSLHGTLGKPPSILLAPPQTDNGTVNEADDYLTLSKYTLYETKHRFYVTASTSAHRHRVLKIDRTSPETLSVVEDQAIYDVKQLELLLRMVDDGNKSLGGLEKVLDFHGIIGFVKFTAAYYMILCTKRSVVGLLGGHYIFHCDETVVLSISGKADKTTEETRLLSSFQQVDLSRNFYFSYSYDLTNTLQVNLTRQTPYPIYNPRFVWNHHLLSPAFDIGGENPVLGHDEGKKCSAWVLPFIYGFVDQAKVPILGRTIYTTLIARRSRHHAGARFLKRGANDRGQVANEVESEQIVSEPLVTAFKAGGMNTNPSRSVPQDPSSFQKAGYANYTSYVQIRGSIPLHWAQDTQSMTPKPPIEISVVDPFFNAAAKHFNDLLVRYGAPVVVVNLIKGKETVPRESKLLPAYAECVAYLNQFLPDDKPDKKIRYIAWDMAQATKTKSQDVIGVLEDIAEESIELTHFFHGGPPRAKDDPDPREGLQLQRGICRTNCIDCLDRTNAAQFSIGKKAFGHQLHALGVIATPDLSFESDAIDMLTNMYHDHGDTLAWQYTGSALVNRMDTYRKIKTRQWSSHSRDILENVKRYYNNSLLDADKQHAMDLFLGVSGELRNAPPPRLHYQQWFSPNTIDDQPSTPTMDAVVQPSLQPPNFAPSYSIWVDYYKPHLLSQFQRLYTYTMNSTAKTAARSSAGHFYSPFVSRIQAKNARRGQRAAAKPKPELPEAAGVFGGGPQTVAMSAKPTGEMPLQHPLENMVAEMMNPSVSDTKRGEYEWYTLYQTNELLSSTETAEPQDLQMYAQSADLARGALPQTSDETVYEKYIYGQGVGGHGGQGHGGRSAAQAAGEMMGMASVGAVDVGSSDDSD